MNMSDYDYTIPVTDATARELVLVDMLERMAKQHLHVGKDGSLWSWHLSSDADAMRVLAKYGRILITSDPLFPGGKGVAGTWRYDEWGNEIESTKGKSH